MCAVSLVYQYGRDNFPLDSWTPARWREYLGFIDKAMEVDKALGDRDCVDPAKELWRKSVEDFLSNGGVGGGFG